MPSNMSGFYALKQRHEVITLTVFNVLSVWVFTSGWSISITFEEVMSKLVLLHLGVAECRIFYFSRKKRF